RQLRGGPRQLLEFVRLDLAGPDLLASDFRLLGENSGCELVRRHFQAEECYRRSGRAARFDSVGLVLQETGGRAERDIGRKAGLSHAGTSGENDEVGPVK